MSRIRYLVSHLMAIFLCCPLCSAEDFTLLGGDLTTRLPAPHALQVPAPNVLDPETKNEQLLGFAPFHRAFAPDEGLGPAFNNNSCGACHIQNGKGPARIPRRVTQAHTMIVKVGLRSKKDRSVHGDLPGVGEQLQEQTVGIRKRQFRVRLRWRKLRRKYPDGNTYTIRKPILRFRVKGFRRAQVGSSLRMSPALVGMGLLEAIPEEAILRLSDPEDADRDGISGTPRYVYDRVTKEITLGRFGFKANHPSVLQQSAAAAFFDMGLLNDLFNPEDGAVELSATTLRHLTSYQQLAGVPAARKQRDPQVQQGYQHFKDVGCQECHVSSFESSHPVHEELDDQLIHPFTDLLLHDMGRGLADTRPEEGVSVREWRTTPLWGLGHTKVVANRRVSYLHDGRAQTLEEAILWHGGEATRSRKAFKRLKKSERHALIAFLNSL